MFLMLYSCTKQTDSKTNSLIVTGIRGAKGSEIVCINIDSGNVVNSTPIECYELCSTVYDPQSGGYGYMTCDTVFRLLDPSTGSLIKSFKLPGCISQSVIDVENNMLIGRYGKIVYHEEPDTTSGRKGEPTYDNFIIRTNLSTGEIVSQKKIDIGAGVNLCSYYYNQKENGYVMLRADNYLITVNPSTGEVVKEINVGKSFFNSVYNPENNTVIGMSYSSEADRNYIEVINAETGSVISSKIVDKEKGFCACISGYDAETDSYITVNSDFEVLFYDTSTGEIKKSYKLNNPMNDIKFWRR